MKARYVVVLLLFALAVYVVLIGYRAVYLIEQPAAALKALGAAVLVIPVVGLYLVLAEVRFGWATERLARQLDEDLPDLPRSPSGRPDRAAADALFEQRRAEVEADPENWRRWYRLAIAYDMAGDRRRARAAMRTAIARSQEPATS